MVLETNSFRISIQKKLMIVSFIISLIIFLMFFVVEAAPLFLVLTFFLAPFVFMAARTLYLFMFQCEIQETQLKIRLPFQEVFIKFDEITSITIYPSTTDFIEIKTKTQSISFDNRLCYQNNPTLDVYVSELIQEQASNININQDMLFSESIENDFYDIHINPNIKLTMLFYYGIPHFFICIIGFVLLLACIDDPRGTPILILFLVGAYYVVYRIFRNPKNFPKFSTFIWKGMLISSALLFLSHFFK